MASHTGLTARAGGLDLLRCGNYGRRGGIVVEVVRNLPNVTPGKNPEGLTIAQIAGNRVIIDMGSGYYAMYAHLAPGSVQLHVGDHVRQGQKLGLVGNTGNSSAPHLHFQVMDRPSSLDERPSVCIRPHES